VGEDVKREIENLELSIAAAKERIAECRRQTKDAAIREKQEHLEFQHLLVEATGEQKKLFVLLYAFLGILGALLLSMLVFGANIVMGSAAAFVALACLVYFLILAASGPYPRAARRVEAEKARLALKTKNHLQLLESEMKDAEETLTFHTAQLEELKQKTKDAN
jgi:Na+/melibiose symporter-like transporter